MNDPYAPSREDHFSFGLWTVGNTGRDPFGLPVRETLSPVAIVENLARLGAWGVNFHDNDLVPEGTSARQRNRILRDFKKALQDHGMVVPMATTNLFSDPIFRDGAFTSNDPAVRAFAVQKVMRAMDLGAELGAKVYVFWGGREGTETDAAKDPVEALKWMRDCLNYLMEYNLSQGYNFKFALEAKPNEPRGDIFLPTTGAMLGFINTLDHPEYFGVNPEVAHETMAGLNFVHAVAQALEAGKLFHIDLNAQKIGRFDQDFRFGSEDAKGAFFLIKLLEDYGYDGPRHFDAHAYRSSNAEDVWAFARGCMRSYKILLEKVRLYNRNKEVQDILNFVKTGTRDADLWSLISNGYDEEGMHLLKKRRFARSEMARFGLPYERLDQIAMEFLWGVRQA
ncbi:MAG: xylose isomerase [Calditrichaeota bacterium]|nr:MAG: xylose isomerase [Calditrichota bacterium]